MFKWPTMLENGDLLYEKLRGPLRDVEAPPCPEFYVRDAENAWLFHPACACPFRQEHRIKGQGCGCLRVLGLCTGNVDTRNKWVSSKICESCPIRTV